uniref:Uncharacterized protein n=1 Tax=Utricularia reniformis TaxID=192314 RepID=A0A1Y0B2U7_9LAMI|nr:hypothetical protein AEK19_MT1589 [Utricularia reniformis]ART31772.1 hypothetical protein AEK19_MT1589 [Utricularia reniformis]
MTGNKHRLERPSKAHKLKTIHPLMNAGMKYTLELQEERKEYSSFRAVATV